ncbi:glycosyltransferase family 4 protein [Desulfovibrio piger]|uniref:glycosyltransferase family 4 protein n=1 Tax=Desulfovibrio piger TaxID=901 RepID=UPI001955F5F7|nr:glycosyltransferase family 4 protein [Desulfovibrio piger]MBM6893878.1 glycosyltransferase family 4 protein [Desulfovibrio piger]
MQFANLNLTLRIPEESTMDIIFLGNTCNNSYNIAKSLRAAGHACTLFYDPTFHPQTFPETEDPEIKYDWPSWIHKISLLDKTPSPYEGPSPSFLEKLRNADLIHCEGYYVLWAKKTGKPYFWFPYGSDSAYYLRWSSWLDLPPWTAIPLKFMDATLHCSGINFSQGVITQAYFKKFLDKYYSGYISKNFFPVDTHKFSPQKHNLDQLLHKHKIEKKTHGLIIFNPTRIMFTKKSDYNYGSDILLKILKELRHNNIDFTLIQIIRNGPDDNEFKKIACQYDLEENIIYINWIRRSDLPAWYSSVDVVVNEFKFGGLGSISLEAMSCGKPLVSNMLPSNLPCSTDSEFTWEPPFYPSVPQEKAIQSLTEAALFPEKKMQRGLLSRQWVLDHASYEVAVQKFIHTYEICLNWGHIQTDTHSFADVTDDLFKKIMHAFYKIDKNRRAAFIAKMLDKYPASEKILGLFCIQLQQDHKFERLYSVLVQLKSINLNIMYTPSLLTKFFLIPYMIKRRLKNIFPIYLIFSILKRIVKIK